MSIASTLRQQVYIRDRACCVYCHSPEELTITTFEVDHITPLSADGKTELNNLYLACPSCNRYKSARQFVIDPQTKQPVPLYHPLKQLWSDHFVWSESHLEIVGLTPIGRATVEVLRLNRPQLIRLRGLWLKLGYTL